MRKQLATVGAIGRWRDIEFKPETQMLYMPQNNQAATAMYIVRLMGVLIGF